MNFKYLEFVDEKKIVNIVPYNKGGDMDCRIRPHEVPRFYLQG